MKIIKNVLVAAMIGGAMGGVLGGLPSAVMAAETAAGVGKAVAEVRRALGEAIAIAAQGSDQRALLDKIKEAKQYAKEITGDQYGVRLQRINSAIAKARGMTRRGDMTGAEAELKKALEIINQFEY